MANVTTMRTTAKVRRAAGRRAAVTMADVLVSLVILCLLTGMAFSEGGLMRAREMSNRVRCAANLSSMYKAMYLYSTNDKAGSFPRTVYKLGDEPTQYTGVDTKNPFGADSTIKPNDVTAAMFLIVRDQQITTEIFTCPSTDAQKFAFGATKSAEDFGNFKSEESLSYSIANPYPSKVATAAGYKWNNSIASDVAIAADMNPGTVGDSDVTTAKGPKDEKAPAEVMAKANSLNHRGAGQNVLYGDGHVTFEANPFCGMKRDNIYTVAPDDTKTTSDKVAGSPGHANDSVLLPVATANPHKKTPAQEEAAAVAMFKAQLPAIRKEIAKAEAAQGETAEIKQAKAQIDAIEKEIAASEKKEGK